MSVRGDMLRQAVKAVADDLAERGIIAYHGSPHDFERFSLSHIGSGEGAQAYGHGLYFAENERVARAYRNDITTRGLDWAQRNLDAHGGDVEKAIAGVEREIQRLRGLPNAGNAPERRDLMVSLKQEALRELKHFRDTGQMNTGHMYEVRLRASPDDFLDYDAPLTQQNERVMAASNRLLDPGWNSNRGWAEGWTPTGESLIGPHSGIEAERRSNILRDSGLQGVRYLDHKSRGPAITFDVGSPRADFGPYSHFTNRDEANAHLALLRQHGFNDAEIKEQIQPQTRNYTVFDDSIVNILRKYAVPGALGLGGASALREALRERASA